MAVGSSGGAELSVRAFAREAEASGKYQLCRHCEGGSYEVLQAVFQPHIPVCVKCYCPSNSDLPRQDLRAQLEIVNRCP